MICHCSEGKFERTRNQFFGRQGEPGVKRLLAVKVGTICDAPPVHDCEYVHTRNQIVTVARANAELQTAKLKDPERDFRREVVYRQEVARMIAEHYAARP